MQILQELSKEDFVELLQHHADLEDIHEGFSDSGVAETAFDTFVERPSDVYIGDFAVESIPDYINKLKQISEEQALEIIVELERDEVVNMIIDGGHFNHSTHCSSHEGQEEATKGLVAITDMTKDELVDHIHANGITNNALDLGFNSDNIFIMEFIGRHYLLLDDELAESIIQ